MANGRDSFQVFIDEDLNQRIFQQTDAMQQLRKNHGKTRKRMTSILVVLFETDQDGRERSRLPAPRKTLIVREQKTEGNG